jgi:8-oxo-dGTP diphosphatase
MINIQQIVDTAIKQGIERFVVGVTIFIVLKILLLKRAEDDFMGGIYELPSRKVKIGETLISALHREVAEETGITINDEILYLGHFDYNSKKGTLTRQFNFLTSAVEPVNIRLQEHSNHAFVSVCELNSYLVTDSVKKVIHHGMENYII